MSPIRFTEIGAEAACIASEPNPHAGGTEEYIRFEVAKVDRLMATPYCDPAIAEIDAMFATDKRLATSDAGAVLECLKAHPEGIETVDITSETHLLNVTGAIAILREQGHIILGGRYLDQDALPLGPSGTQVFRWIGMSEAEVTTFGLHAKVSNKRAEWRLLGGTTYADSNRVGRASKQKIPPPPNAITEREAEEILAAAKAKYAEILARRAKPVELDFLDVLDFLGGRG